MLETWRGMLKAAAGDAAGMRAHLERAVQIATEQGLSAARCEALALLALEAARLGAESKDEELLKLAEDSATEAKNLTEALPGHAPWGARGDAALALVALAVLLSVAVDADAEGADVIFLVSRMDVG